LNVGPYVICMVCCRAPLVPVTDIGEGPICPQSPNVTVSIDVADPPEDTVTLVGLNDAVMPPLSDSVKETVPENPFVLVTVIVALCVEPATRKLPKDVGFDVIVKSPVACTGKIVGATESIASSTASGNILGFIFRS